MIIKNYMFLTLIIILQLRTSNGDSSSDFETHMKRAPCCPGDNVMTFGGCLISLKDAINETDNGDQTTSREPKMKPNLQCPSAKYLIDYYDEAYVDDNEDLYVENRRVAEKGMFCLSRRTDVSDSRAVVLDQKGQPVMTNVALVCFQEMEDVFLPTYITGSLAFVSVGFLLLTLLVYAIVPQLRDLQGKCIMCTATTLCIGYFHLATTQIFHYSSATTCEISSYLLYFWMLGAFFWMNVVSINVMWSVVSRMSTTSDKKAFMYYNIYGWGSPLLFLIAAIIADNVEGDHIKPGFGTRGCWFDDKLETWTYFYGPMAILIACNIILFVITSIKLWNQTSYENLTKLKIMRYRFLLYLKIFLVMGISWIFEIISYVHDTRHIVWMVTDTFNCLQGVVFFLVLVLFRKRALKGLAARGIKIPCINTAHSGPDEECDEIIQEEEAPAMTTFS